MSLVVARKRFFGIGSSAFYGLVKAGWRLGRGLPQGFATFVESGGGGIGMNPVIDVPNDKWNVYFSIIPRISALGYTVFLDTNTFKDHLIPELITTTFLFR